MEQYEKQWYKYYWKNFVLKYKNKLDWYEISKNPNITWEIVLNNTDRIWFWMSLSRNPNITWDIIQSNPNIP